MEMAEAAAKTRRLQPHLLAQLARPWWIFPTVAILSVLVYANALKNDFVWDDHELIVDNPAVHSLTNAPDFFTSHFWSQSNQPSARGYYRPVVLLSYALDYSAWGLKPAGFHLTNILLHALAATLVCVVVLQLTEKAAAALFAGVLFAVHPVHTESVAFISGRTDVLATIFVLLSLCLFLQVERSKLRDGTAILMISLFVFALGLLSKEVAAALPLLLAAIEIAKPAATPIRKKLILHGPFWLLLTAYLGLRFGLLRIRPDIQGRLAPAEIALTMPGVALDYLRLLAVPSKLCADYVVYVQRAFSLMSVAALGLFLCVIFVAVFLLIRKRMSGLFVLWILLCLLPVLQIIPISVLKAERFLYLPSVGYCALLGLIAAPIFKDVSRRRNLVGLIAVQLLILLFAFQTRSRCSVWSDDFSLYRNTAIHAPGNFRVQYNLGNIYFRRGDLQQGLKHTQIAYLLKPDFPQAAFNLGVMYEAAARTEEAERMYRNAIQLNPSYAAAHNNLASLLFAQARYAEAKFEWLTALALDKDLPQAKQGLLLLEQNRAIK